MYMCVYIYIYMYISVLSYYDIYYSAYSKLRARSWRPLEEARVGPERQGKVSQVCFTTNHCYSKQLVQQPTPFILSLLGRASARTLISRWFDGEKPWSYVLSQPIQTWEAMGHGSYVFGCAIMGGHGPRRRPHPRHVSRAGLLF